MDDPLLTSLCRICHTNVPKYSCPRCSLQTCSLPCSRRHKLWSACSGIRDPTVFIPRSQLATPSGIDHDYNFLHSIEHKIERSEKAIVDKDLVEKGELAAARRSEDVQDWHDQMRKRKRQNPGEVPIEKCLKRMRTTVELAPKGMKRSVENGTTWARNARCIHWQVEWIREGDVGRSLSKAIGVRPIGKVYEELWEEERKVRNPQGQKRLEKKQRQRTKKSVDFSLSTLPILQDTSTGTWDFAPAVTSKPPVPAYYLYLHRPKTPLSFPKVLVPLNPAKSLEELLRRRLVLEFPTIYVLSAQLEDLPRDEFMLERDYLSATGQPPWQDSDTEMQDSNDETSGDGTDESETSDSSSGSDEDMEDGEVGK